jgi:hypothetical protein
MTVLLAIVATLALQIGLTIYCFQKQSMKRVREDLRLAKFHL